MARFFHRHRHPRLLRNMKEVDPLCRANTCHLQYCQMTGDPCASCDDFRIMKTLHGAIDFHRNNSGGKPVANPLRQKHLKSRFIYFLQHNWRSKGHLELRTKHQPRFQFLDSPLTIEGANLLPRHMIQIAVPTTIPAKFQEKSSIEL